MIGPFDDTACAASSQRVSSPVLWRLSETINFNSEPIASEYLLPITPPPTLVLSNQFLEVLACFDFHDRFIA